MHPVTEPCNIWPSASVGVSQGWKQWQRGIVCVPKGWPCVGIYRRSLGGKTQVGQGRKNTTESQGKKIEWIDFKSVIFFTLLKFYSIYWGPANRTAGEKAYNNSFLLVWCGRLFSSIKQRPYLLETWRDAPSVALCHRNITRLHSVVLSGIWVVEGRKEILPKSAVCHSATDAGDKGGTGGKSARWSSEKLPQIELMKQMSSDKKEEAHLWLK